MSERERAPWLRLWLRDLERFIDGPYIPSVSLAIDAATLEIESTGART